MRFLIKSIRSTIVKRCFLSRQNSFFYFLRNFKIYESMIQITHQTLCLQHKVWCVIIYIISDNSYHTEISGEGIINIWLLKTKVQYVCTEVDLNLPMVWQMSRLQCLEYNGRRSTQHNRRCKTCKFCCQQRYHC